MTQPSIALYRSPLSESAGLAATGFGQHSVREPILSRILPGCAVVLVERGAGWLQTERTGRVEFSAPALFWLFAHRRHSYGPDRHGWEERWALFDGALVRNFSRLRLMSEDAPLVHLRDLGEMQRLFATLHAEMLDDTALGQASAASTLHRIVVRAARQASAREKLFVDADVETVVDALRNRALQTVDLADFAGQHGMSPATLRRKFLGATGLSPKAYQLRLRIDRAKELLATGELGVEAVAQAVGIEDAFYFARLFRDREDCSPTEFRRRYRRA